MRNKNDTIYITTDKGRAWAFYGGYGNWHGRYRDEANPFPLKKTTGDFNTVLNWCNEITK